MNKLKQDENDYLLSTSEILFKYLELEEMEKMYLQEQDNDIKNDKLLEIHSQKIVLTNEYMQIVDPNYILAANHNEYNIVQDNKTFNVILNKSDLQEFKRNIKCYLHDRNLIVHCSIINELGDILIDTTNCFRKFSFYFKTDQTLLIFNEYLQTKYPDIFYGNGNYLVLYFNDSEFTEYKISTTQLNNTIFNSIFSNFKFTKEFSVNCL